MLSEETKSTWRSRLDYCIENEHELSDGEIEFIDSMDIQLTCGIDLTPRQTKRLHKIYYKVVK